MRSSVLTVLTLLAVLLPGGRAEAGSDCVFELTGVTMRLVADCTTDESIVIPDGMTLDGARHTITAVDPEDGHFVGAVIVSGGATATVIDTGVTTAGLTDTCDDGVARLRGILFDGASGAIRGNVVVNVNQGESRCEEGNAIEIRNCSAAAARVEVDIDRNVVDAYQKAGIVVSCGVDARITDNQVGASATQRHVTAYAVQVGFGAWAAIERNEIAGNSWPTRSAAASAVLLLQTAQGTTVRHNRISGNADVGIFVRADGAIVDGNRLIESGPDGYFDVGIGSYDVSGRGYSTTNVVVNNEVRGYATAYDVLGGRQADSGDRQVE